MTIKEVDKIDQRILQFSLGDENYAIPLLQVREVIGVPPTTPVPDTPGYFTGIMNLRGQVISIVDLRKKLNIKITDETPEEAVIIVDVFNAHVGIIVDSVNKVITTNLEDLQKGADLEQYNKLSYVEGVLVAEDSLTLIVDPNQLFKEMDFKSAQLAA